MFNRKTKIVCTIGPASESEEMLRTLISGGMNVARINFSHCPYDEAIARVDKIRKIRAELDVPVSIMLDTKGPEVRLGGYKEKITIGRKDNLCIISDTVQPSFSHPTMRTLTTNLPNISNLCTVGTRLLLQDGFIECTVTEIMKNGGIVARVENAGILKEKAHLSIPGANYPLPFLSDKDKEDIKFGIKTGFEFIALSFVRKVEDIEQVRALIREINPESPIRLIAKIEERHALDNLDEIISASDGIMVARGDLGVEVEIERLPIIQKQIIEKCYLSGRPVIVATQMLESMTDNNYPTRAEVSDVANAVFDSTSAVMLSGETANGVHPEKVLTMMNKIIENAEGGIDFGGKAKANRLFMQREDLTNIMSYSAIQIAKECNAKAIAIITINGLGARSLSKFRPGVPVWAFTFSDAVYQQMALNWGITPVLLKKDGITCFAQAVEKTLNTFRERGVAVDGDKIVIVASVPLGEARPTNTTLIEIVGSPRGQHEYDLVLPY